MRDHSNHIELTRQAALAEVLQQPLWEGAPTGVEVVPVDQACGRVLAADVVSRIDAPNCLTCRMDSIALRWADVEAGVWNDGVEVPRGEQWQFANTGVAMPEGFDTAVMVEQVRFSDDAQAASIVELPSHQFAGTSQPGSKLHCGDVIAHAGVELAPLDLAAIKAGNVGTVSVHCKPRVAFIPTGNELAGGNGAVERGKNVETNSALFRALVEKWGGVPVVFDIVPDKRDLIEVAISQALEVADIVVVNGGSSKGSDDWCVEVADEMGQMICHQMAHGPGRHSWIAVVDSKPVVGVSGPPAGAEFALRFYVRPLVRRFLGLSTEPQFFTARLAEPFPAPKHHGSKPGGRPKPHRPGGPGEGFCGIRLVSVSVGADGVVEARPVAAPLGSNEARTANAIYMMPVGTNKQPPKPGDLIQVELRD